MEAVRRDAAVRVAFARPGTKPKRAQAGRAARVARRKNPGNETAAHVIASTASRSGPLKAVSFDSAPASPFNGACVDALVEAAAGRVVQLYRTPLLSQEALKTLLAKVRSV